MKRAQCYLNWDLSTCLPVSKKFFFFFVLPLFLLNFSTWRSSAVTETASKGFLPLSSFRCLGWQTETLCVMDLEQVQQLGGRSAGWEGDQLSPAGCFRNENVDPARLAEKTDWIIKFKPCLDLAQLLSYFLIKFTWQTVMRRSPAVQAEREKFLVLVAMRGATRNMGPEENFELCSSNFKLNWSKCAQLFKVSGRRVWQFPIQTG